jgi:hypothetical protein
METADRAERSPIAFRAVAQRALRLRVRTTTISTIFKKAISWHPQAMAPAGFRA